MRLPLDDSSPIRPGGTQRTQGLGTRLRHRRTDIQSHLQRQGSRQNVRLHHSANLQPHQDPIRPHVQTVSTGAHLFPPTSFLFEMKNCLKNDPNSIFMLLIENNNNGNNYAI